MCATNAINWNCILPVEDLWVLEWDIKIKYPCYWIKVEVVYRWHYFSKDFVLHGKTRL